ncbi:MAG: RDD family protein [Oscillospiraceae bacterium]|nr:RDD family protein [Oscillospiraceae bacterium]
MVHDIQKAGMWKRIAAWMFDMILLSVLAVGCCWLLSAVVGYDGYSDSVSAAYDKYAAEYGVSFAITQEDYDAMTETERLNYDAAYEALVADDEAIYAYNMMINLTMVIATIGILLAVMGWEFVVPLLLGNGQTLGKKIFGLCLIRNDGVKVNNMQLFTRTLLGKFTIETMIPVYMVLMLYWGIIGLTGTLILLAVLIAQIVCLAVTRHNCAIHDLLAGTVVVDMSSQTIFRTTEDLIAYQKKAAAERASRQAY